MPRLAGKIAFITGAGNGIGRATAILFAREGAKVAIAEIDARAGEETAHLAGHEAIAIRADVTDPDSLQSAIRATVDKFGRLDVLHNNAGGSTAQDDTAVNAPLDEFWRAIKLDLYGTFLGCRFGIPELVKAGGGSVINMSSNVALMGVAGRDCYDLMEEDPPLVPVAWENILDVWYNYVKGHNPKDYFGIYDVVRFDTFWLDKA
jgi:NAD(P)-dependent dehydrogenase (short-subunit alcohol dehydrogenase family)